MFTISTLLKRSGIAAALVLCLALSASAQKFDYKRLDTRIKPYTVIIDMTIEMSFGMQTNEEEEHFLGTIVREDGLVIFNGAVLNSDNLFSNMAGVSVKTTATSIRVKTLDGRSFGGEYLGADRFSNIGFIRIQADSLEKFTPVVFTESRTLTTGDWVTLYRLLPDFISPPLAADIGMVSTIIESPEKFPLTVGFVPEQLTSVVFDGNLVPIGVLGTLMDPSAASQDGSGMLESFDGSEMPNIGIITGDRLKKILMTPPSKSTTDRGWLGVTLQGLTKDLIEYWKLGVSGGIIISDVVKNSPGAKAGLQVGDIVYEVNKTPVLVDREENIAIFQRTIAEMGPGAKVTFSVMRLSADKPTKTTLETTLEKAPLAATDAEEFENKSLEFTTRNLVFADFLNRGLEQNEITGVVVSKLEQGGPAAVGGLQIGDIIQRVGSTPVTSVEDIRKVSETLETSAPREVVFFVWRFGSTLFVNVKPK